MKNRLNEKIRQEIINKFRFDEPVYVTRPNMPSLEQYEKCLNDIWNTRKRQ